MGHQVVYPHQELFVESVESYWSRSVRLSPACIIQPESVEDVSVAVSTLVQEGGSLSSCKFAVRSGGHTVWAGAANIEDGVTIDLSKMNSTTHHPENKTASIYPGARWGSVYKTLEQDNVTVAGGRGGPVGVGGFLIGGERYATLLEILCSESEQVEIPFIPQESVSHVTTSSTTKLSWPAVPLSTPTTTPIPTYSKL